MNHIGSLGPSGGPAHGPAAKQTTNQKERDNGSEQHDTTFATRATAKHLHDNAPTFPGRIEKSRRLFSGDKIQDSTQPCVRIPGMHEIIQRIHHQDARTRQHISTLGHVHNGPARAGRRPGPSRGSATYKAERHLGCLTGLGVPRCPARIVSVQSTTLSTPCTFHSRPRRHPCRIAVNTHRVFCGLPANDPKQIITVNAGARDSVACAPPPCRRHYRAPARTPRQWAALFGREQTHKEGNIESARKHRQRSWARKGITARIRRGRPRSTDQGVTRATTVVGASGAEHQSTRSSNSR